ncbi:hypothetical protein Fmac_007745 [Flemingia macrophylla]|uniref:WAT1-related protein n=1 Tax=Flemingia macrophylla TaxID=520843 RepID=A0ABD1MVF1_9FABA
MAGNYIFGKDVLNHGMSRFVFIVYRNSMATIALAPFAFFVERLERLKLREVRSQAKVIGTLVTFGGALLMAFYKGPAFNLFHSGSTTQHENGSPSSHSQQTAGAIYILMGCAALSSFYILQTVFVLGEIFEKRMRGVFTWICYVLGGQSITVKRYPAELSLATLICLAGAAETTAVALVAERHSSAWALGWDNRLYAPLYTGLVSSGIAYYVQGLVMKLRDPVFATAFNPLCMIVVAGLGSLILGEQLHLGSIIGGVIIVLGLYSVVWGKAKDYADPKLLSVDRGATKSPPITATEDSKVDIIDENLEKQPSTNKQKLEGEETELHVVKV